MMVCWNWRQVCGAVLAWASRIGAGDEAATAGGGGAAQPALASASAPKMVPNVRGVTVAFLRAAACSVHRRGAAFKDIVASEL